MDREINVKPIVAISGGFDPIHYGHVRLIEEASNYGSVVIILNSDDWLVRKKGFKFMDWENRAKILLAMKRVEGVSRVDDKDGTVCEALNRIEPDYFANGGDRTSENTPEQEICREKGIKLLWNIGGGKIASSSELVNATRA